MPPKKKTGNEALVAAVRDSNRWGDLDEEVEYRDRQRRFYTAVAGAESESTFADDSDGRVIRTTAPTKSKRRVRPGNVPMSQQVDADGEPFVYPGQHQRYGSVFWNEGHIYAKKNVEPPPFDTVAGKAFRPREKVFTGYNPNYATERFPANSQGPRVVTDRLTHRNLWDDERLHSETGDHMLEELTGVQQANLHLPLARSAAVNSVLHYVLDTHGRSNKGRRRE